VLGHAIVLGVIGVADVRRWHPDQVIQTDDGAMRIGETHRRFTSGRDDFSGRAGGPTHCFCLLSERRERDVRCMQ